MEVHGVVVAVADIGVELLLIGRVFGDVANGAGVGVLAEQGPLWAAQHLDPFDIGQAGHAVDRPWQVDVVDVLGDVRIEDGIGVADTPDEEDLSGRGDAAPHDLNARNLTGEVARGDQVLGGDFLRPDHGYGNRRLLQAGRLTGGRDDHILHRRGGCSRAR